MLHGIFQVGTQISPQFSRVSSVCVCVCVLCCSFLLFLLNMVSFIVCSSDKSLLKTGDLEWYFFCPRGKKYASGGRMNRATEVGYWKTTGKDRSVEHKNGVVGMIKTLVFHTGRAPKGDRTDWVMHEFRLEDKELADKGIPQVTIDFFCFVEIYYNVLHFWSRRYIHHLVANYFVGKVQFVVVVPMCAFMESRILCAFVLSVSLHKISLTSLSMNIFQYTKFTSSS